MDSIYGLFREPNWWLRTSGQVNFVWGIFNPNGPTIYCAGWSCSSEPDVQEIFVRWMNPFAQGAYGLGRFDATEDDAHSIHASILTNAARPRSPFLPEGYGLFKCIPSFLYSPDTTPTMVEVLKETVRIGLVNHQDDWGRELYYLRKYAFRLFDRAGEETREALEEESSRADPRDEGVQKYFQFMRARHANIPSFRDWLVPQYEHHAYTEEAFDEWVNAVTGMDFLIAALRQVAEAWAGAISLVSKDGPPVVLTFEDVNRFLRYFNCPIWPENWTSDNLLRRSY